MKQQQLQARLQQAQLLRRRMAVMNTTRGSVLGSSAVSPGAPPAPGAVVMPPLQAPGPPHQPGIGLKPGSQTPPANVLQVVKQVLHMADNFLHTFITTFHQVLSRICLLLSDFLSISY